GGELAGECGERITDEAIRAIEEGSLEHEIAEQRERDERKRKQRRIPECQARTKRRRPGAHGVTRGVARVVSGRTGPSFSCSARVAPALRERIRCRAAW